MYESHLELARVLELVELGFHLERLVQILQELTLKGDDLVDVAEKGVDFGVRHEGFSLQWLQVVFQKAVQMLKFSHKKKFKMCPILMKKKCVIAKKSEHGKNRLIKNFAGLKLLFCRKLKILFSYIQRHLAKPL